MDQNITNIIIILVLAVIFFFACRGFVSHIKGEGGCCGGGTGIKKVKPRKLENIVAIKTVMIDGMTCENCYARVHNALNSIEGVSATVKGSKKQAVVRMDRLIDDGELKKVINNLGYTVKEIV